MDKPRVKPLVWRVDDSRTAYAQTRYFVDRYCIEHRLHGDDQFDLWIGPDAVRATRFPTLETAKAAAQADYEARILAALEPATVQRCAECDCDNPPDGCNWIAAEPAPITVQEAARDDALTALDQLEAVEDAYTHWMLANAVGDPDLVHRDGNKLSQALFAMLNDGPDDGPSTILRALRALAERGE